MTLGCGAAAGNITSDNVGPQHLFNIKRLAYAVRTAAEAFETPAPARVQGHLAAEVVDRFMARHAAGGADHRFVSSALAEPERCAVCAAPAPAQPAAKEVVDFVCEEDVRIAIKHSKKIYIVSKTIVTPAARDLASPSDILVLA